MFKHEQIIMNDTGIHYVIQINVLTLELAGSKLKMCMQGVGVVVKPTSNLV